MIILYLAINCSFYIYSFKTNSIIKNIDFNFGFLIEVGTIKMLSPLNENELYFLYNNNINVLNLKYEFFYPLSQWEYEFNNSFVLLSKESMIANANNKIIFLKSSKIKTLTYAIFFSLITTLINYYVKSIISYYFIDISSFNGYYFIYNLLSIFIAIRMRYFQKFIFDISKKNIKNIGESLLFSIFVMIFPINIVIYLFLIVCVIFILILDKLVNR